MAETRCNTLKDQLDYMKQIYGVKKSAVKSRKISNAMKKKKKSSDDEYTLSSASVGSTENRVRPKRQSSNAISTDNTGAAVRTINNILNGITDSVNRLSELHVQITESPRMRVVCQNAPLPHNNGDNIQRMNPMSTESEELQGPHIGTSGISTKSKTIKRKSKESKLTAKKPSSSKSINRGSKTDKRTKLTRSSILERSIPAPRKKEAVNNNLKVKTQEKLVEIYHNMEAKSSDSDEGNNKNKDRGARTQSNNVSEAEIPPLDISKQNKTMQIFKENGGSRSAGMRQNVNAECYYDPPEAPRTSQSCCYRNYELPTIASKMKQVAKSYLSTFNFKVFQAIPFCAAISTSPSHNIGINIQQVMNIIKNRHPVNGISPTLAHNIGLAAERLNSKPLSTLVSTINSRTCYRSSLCPLSKPSLNYQQLQDMAKSIPEETAEEVEGEVDSPEVRTIVITGPSGEMEVKNRVVPVWAADPAQPDQCTCVIQPENDLQHVASKYKRNGTALSSLTTVSQKNRRWGTKKNNARGGFKRPHSQVNGYVPVPEEPQPLPQEHPLHGKEKNLKEVLTNLHNEFETLNKRYEELSQKVNGDDDDTLKELEKLETELNKKEEEIVMVMTLYKEVLALKQQIKSLKQKTSQPSVALSDSKESPANFKEYNNPQAAFHLTKLLKQIQMYQMRYKKEVE
ncbi:hypothetical protein JTB14_020209 [Gonioctena quinquepunctata]|nr:hypothetical protein JTB14_020209 [Gonioctena quinquepunctata]